MCHTGILYAPTEERDVPISISLKKDDVNFKGKASGQIFKGHDGMAFSSSEWGTCLNIGRSPGRHGIDI